MIYNKIKRAIKNTSEEYSNGEYMLFRDINGWLEYAYHLDNIKMRHIKVEVKQDGIHLTPSGANVERILKQYGLRA